MKGFEYVITDEIGIHARPAGLLVKKAKSYEDKIVIACQGKQAEATKLMALMGLGARKGTVLKVTVEGPTEESTAAELERFLKENL